MTVAYRRTTGKNVNVMSKTRLADSGFINPDPINLSIGINNDLWFAGNVAQKIYNVSFNNQVIQELNYADIDGAISEITGLDINADNTLWFLLLRMG